MWLHTLMFESPVLLEASALLAGKTTVPTLQKGPGARGGGSSGVPPLLMEPQSSSSRSNEWAQATVQISRLQGAALGLVSPQGPFLLTAKGTGGAGEEATLLLLSHSRVPVTGAGLCTPTVQESGVPVVEGKHSRMRLGAPTLSSPAPLPPAALGHVRGDGGEPRAKECAGAAVELALLKVELLRGSRGEGRPCQRGREVRGHGRSFLYSWLPRELRRNVFWKQELYL